MGGEKWILSQTLFTLMFVYILQCLLFVIIKQYIKIREMNMNDPFSYLYTSVSKPLSHKVLFYVPLLVCVCVCACVCMYVVVEVSVFKQVWGNVRLHKNEDIFWL